MLTNRGELFLFFIIGLLFTLFAPLLLPGYKLFYFTPFIIRVFYLKPYSTTLWISCFLGIFMDFLSFHIRFGILALNYTLTSAVLYSQKRNFFEDSPSTLPVLTFFYSICSTFFQILLLIIFENGVAISWEFVKIDLLYLPFLDAFYTFLIFVLPKILFGKPQRKGKDYFLTSNCL